MAKSKTEAPLNGGERHPDADAREAIRSDLHTTMLVEAAAGTGKTTSLVDRMVALVATGAARVESLSAVTFTIRAAAQLTLEALEDMRLRVGQDACAVIKASDVIVGVPD